MDLDLHIHTTKYSRCSAMTPDDLMIAAKGVGLDGVCLTEHNRLWSSDDARELASRYGLAVFRGMEITTTGGDILVFGLEEEPDGLWTPEILKAKVDAVGALAIAAHPFRGFFLFGPSDLAMSISDAMQTPTFQCVHGLEVCNGMVTLSENEFARRVAQGLGLLQIGGSDAHRMDQVGICITRFHDTIHDERDLIEAIRAERYTLLRTR